MELRVAESGRWLVPSGSRVRIRDECGGVAFRVGRRARPVRIAANGRFEFRGRGPRAVRLRGRFATRGTARLAISYHPSLNPPVPVSCGDRVQTELPLERVRRYPLRDCRSHPEKSKLDAATGRVFNDFYYGRKGWEDVAWACLFSENRRVILGRRPYDTDDAGFGPFKLVGAFVAFREFECFALSCPDWWKLVDLRSGDTLRELPRDLGVGYLESVVDLELGENGLIGVIVAGSVWEPRPLEVWAYGVQGPRLLDSGNIARDSLELEGSTLRWLKDGVQQTAVLE